jgi:hypothetical protein
MNLWRVLGFLTMMGMGVWTEVRSELCLGPTGKIELMNYSNNWTPKAQEQF